MFNFYFLFYFYFILFFLGLVELELTTGAAAQDYSDVAKKGLFYYPK